MNINIEQEFDKQIRAHVNISHIFSALFYKIVFAQLLFPIILLVHQNIRPPASFFWLNGLATLAVAWNAPSIFASLKLRALHF